MLIMPIGATSKLETGQLMILLVLSRNQKVVGGVAQEIPINYSRMTGWLGVVSKNHFNLSLDRGHKWLEKRPYCMPLLSAQITLLAAFQTWKPIEEILTFGVWKQKKVGYNEEDDHRDLTPRIVEQSDSSKSEKPLKPQPIMIHLSPLDIFRGREKQNATVQLFPCYVDIRRFSSVYQICLIFQHPSIYENRRAIKVKSGAFDKVVMLLIST